MSNLKLYQTNHECHKGNEILDVLLAIRKVSVCDGRKGILITMTSCTAKLVCKNINLSIVNHKKFKPMKRKKSQRNVKECRLNWYKGQNRITIEEINGLWWPVSLAYSPFNCYVKADPKDAT